MSDALNVITGILQILFTIVGAGLIVTGGILFGASRLAKRRRLQEQERLNDACNCHPHTI